MSKIWNNITDRSTFKKLLKIYPYKLKVSSEQLDDNFSDVVENFGHPSVWKEGWLTNMDASEIDQFKKNWTLLTTSYDWTFFLFKSEEDRIMARLLL